MNEKKEVISQLEIFELGQALAKLLNGDKEAIADVGILLNRHPEMFKNVEEVIDIIQKVVKKPDLIMDNPKSSDTQDYIAAKILNEKKMGDIGIKNSKGTAVVYHTTKQDKRNFNRLVNRAVNGRAVHSLYTPSQAWMGGNGKNPSSANALSLTTSNSLPQQSQNVNNNTQQDKALTKEEFMQQEQEKMASAKKAKETKKKDEELEI